MVVNNYTVFGFVLITFISYTCLVFVIIVFLCFFHVMLCILWYVRWQTVYPSITVVIIILYVNNIKMYDLTVFATVFEFFLMPNIALKYDMLLTYLLTYF